MCVIYFIFFSFLFVLFFLVKIKKLKKTRRKKLEKNKKTWINNDCLAGCDRIYLMIQVVRIAWEKTKPKWTLLWKRTGDMVTCSLSLFLSPVCLTAHVPENMTQPEARVKASHNSRAVLLHPASDTQPTCGMDDWVFSHCHNLVSETKSTEENCMATTTKKKCIKSRTSNDLLLSLLFTRWSWQKTFTSGTICPRV